MKNKKQTAVEYLNDNYSDLFKSEQSGFYHVSKSAVAEMIEGYFANEVEKALKPYKIFYNNMKSTLAFHRERKFKPLGTTVLRDIESFINETEQLLTKKSKT